MCDSKKPIRDLDNEIGEVTEEVGRQYAEDAINLWNALSVDKQMLLFYYVTKQITEAELKDDNETYRHILYDRFGFPPESYQLGVMSGFMKLHNAIVRPSEQPIFREFTRERFKNVKKRDVH